MARLVSVNMKCACGATLVGKVALVDGIADPAPDKVFELRECPSCMGALAEDVYSQFSIGGR